MGNLDILFYLRDYKSTTGLMIASLERALRANLRRRLDRWEEDMHRDEESFRKLDQGWLEVLGIAMDPPIPRFKEMWQIRLPQFKSVIYETMIDNHYSLYSILFSSRFALVCETDISEVSVVDMYYGREM
jgi:hypothetical protein